MLNLNFRNSNRGKIVKPLIIIIAIVLVLIGVKYISANKSSSNGITVSSSKDVKSMRITLNQTFDLPIPTKDNSLSPLKVTFTTAQLTNRIVVGGKAKNAAKGTQFLMLNLLIENSNNKRVNLKTRDMIRLIDNNNKKFAPRYFNKDVAIEADAVKKDTLGFLVPEDIKIFKIQYGLVSSGDKKILELKFE